MIYYVRRPIDLQGFLKQSLVDLMVYELSK